MRIYNKEKDIADRIQAACNFTLEARSSLSSVIPENYINFLENGEKTKQVESAIRKLTKEKHPDLMFGTGILASTVMNGNDDIFIPKEIWPVRSTVVNTHLDVEHNTKKIIGHNYAVRALDESGKEIDASLKEYDDYFDLEVDFVVYKALFPKTTAKFQKLFKKGEAFLSMEGRIQDFDYGLVDAKGNVEVIPRNDETSFLTKELRVFEGQGVYKDRKIGRVLKGFRFTGNGWVKVPANKASSITKLSASTSASLEAPEIKRTVLLDRRHFALV